MKHIELPFYRLLKTNKNGRYSTLKGTIDIKEVWESNKEVFITLNNCDTENDILPVYDRPFLIISEQVKDVLSFYEPEIKFRKCVFAEERYDVIEAAYLVKAPELDCLHSSSEVLNKGLIKNIIIDRNKVDDRRVFQLKGIIAQYLIVNTEVVEALLHENIWPFEYQEIETR